MYVSIQTLQNLVDLSGHTPQQIADRLTMAGLEIESIKPFEDDTILELKITPNRADALSHYGVARELAAVLGTRTTFLTPTVKELGASLHDLVQVSVADKSACPRYAVRVLEGVQIAPSPEWLQKKLLSLGLRPINNVVDVTNWVLHERGQPLHAFDLDKLAKPRGRVTIKVRFAEENEQIETLDGIKRKLAVNDLVIADEEKALAIAGVMGGANSQVTEPTQNILLESAYFSSNIIRKTSKRLGLSTDSSYRFERGTDPNAVLISLDRAASLIQEIAGGRIRRESIDLYPNVIEPLEVSLRPARLAALSALPESEIDASKLRSRFLGLGIETSGKAGHDALKFRIPTFRPDITEEIDLIEEAIRLIGFEQVPTEISLHQSPTAKSIPQDLEYLESKIKLFLADSGMHEAINYAFGSPTKFEPFSNGPMLTLQNPLGEEFSAMRPSLLPGLLSNIESNLRLGAEKPALFEVGVVFGGLNARGHEPKQGLLGIESMGADSFACESLSLAGVVQGSDFYALKGILEGLFERIRLETEFTPAKKAPSYFHPAQTASFEGGFVGALHPSLKQYAGMFAFEINLDAIRPLCFKMVKAKILPKFPGIKRDFALLLDENVLAADIEKSVRSYRPIAKVLEDVKVFDVYRGKGIEPGKKSVAFSVMLRDADKTLTESEITPWIDGLTKLLVESLGASIRGM